jgi:hypothetical protein
MFHSTSFFKIREKACGQISGLSPKFRNGGIVRAFSQFVQGA